jgi:creatinine amidohydrolase
MQRLATLLPFEEPSMTVTVRDTWKCISDSKVELAIVPIGSVEQHADHLPVGTDLFTAQAIATAVAARLDCFLLPVIPFSVSIEHLGRPGTIAIRGDTLVAYVRDILESLGQHGIKRVCLVSGHGGNFILRPAVREWNLRGGHPRTILAWPWMGAAAKFTSEHTDDKHAGEWETSVMLEIDDAAVLRPFSADSVPDVDFELCDYAGWERVAENGVWGRPSLATKTKGQLFLRQATDFLADYIPRTFDAVDRLWLDRNRAIEDAT